MSGFKTPKRKDNRILIRPDSLYNHCLLKMAEMTTIAHKELDWDEVDRLVVEVARRYVPGENNLDEVITHITTNLVYGFTDDIPF